jgi:hypothetical protein
MKITKKDCELKGLTITPCEHSSKCGNKWRIHHFGQMNQHLPMDNPLDVGYDYVMDEPQLNRYLVSP